MTMRESNAGGGADAVQRPSFLPFALPDIGPSEHDAVRRVLESGWITTGEVTERFERAFAEKVGARHAVALNSCTAALHLALEAVGVGPGDEVITTPYTFGATAEVIRYFDARPVFVDVDPETLNICPAAVRRAITPRTKAILPVGIAGLAPDLAELVSIARAANLPLVEDAAHCFPASYEGRAVGSWSDITCFSFYATKTITTGEGGMLTTDRDDWARRCRLMALHGIDRQPFERSTGRNSWYYEIVAPGYKYNLTDLAAALGIAQLERAGPMRDRRREIAAAYDAAFSDDPSLQIPPRRTDDEGHAWHLYMLRLNLDTLGIDRAEFARQMQARNIGISVHFIPLHLHPYYRDKYGYAPDDFPVAYGEYLREISLPLYSRMSDDDVADVIGAVMDVLDRARVSP